MFITQVLLPKRNNFGQRLPVNLYQSFHARMVRRYGGWTRKGQAEGVWLGAGGHFFADEHWVYEIGHARRDVRFWQAEKERLKAEFDQEEIWIVQYHGRRI
jgi:hypothetical protein